LSGVRIRKAKEIGKEKELKPALQPNLLLPSLSSPAGPIPLPGGPTHSLQFLSRRPS